MNRFRLFILVAFVTFVMAPTAIAFATDPPVDPTGVIKVNDTLASVQLSAGTVTFLIATVIPIVVGLLTPLASKWKGPLMILLTAVDAMLVTATVADGTAILSQQTLEVMIKGLVGAYGAYYGVLKPRGITSSAVTVPAATQGQVVHVPGRLADMGLK